MNAINRTVDLQSHGTFSSLINESNWLFSSLSFACADSPCTDPAGLLLCACALVGET